MGITCHLYSSVCLPEFFLGVNDLGNLVLLNIVLGESAAVEAGITGKPFLVEVLLLTLADGGARMETMDNSLFLDLEFVCVLHCTLLPRPGAGHLWGMSERRLSAPMDSEIVPAGHWLWPDPGLGPFQLSLRRLRRSRRSLESFEESICLKGA